MTLSFIKPHIALSGLIGAGKTTLADELGKQLNLKVYHEGVATNTYLNDFYKDMKKHGFALQIHLLNRRFREQQTIIWQDEGAVQDRSFYEDTVFARMLHETGNMDARDLQTYLDLFKNMSNFMRRPTMIVHLEVTPEEALARIRKRARVMEAGITLEYLQALHREYEVFIAEINQSIPVIRIDYSKFHDVDEIVATVKREFDALKIVRVVKVERSPYPLE
jgi:deoxyadenosine kinase